MGPFSWETVRRLPPTHDAAARTWHCFLRVAPSDFDLVLGACLAGINCVIMVLIRRPCLFGLSHRPEHGADRSADAFVFEHRHCCLWPEGGTQGPEIQSDPCLLSYVYNTALGISLNEASFQCHILKSLSPSGKRYKGSAREADRPMPTPASKMPQIAPSPSFYQSRHLSVPQPPHVWVCRASECRDPGGEPGRKTFRTKAAYERHLEASGSPHPTCVVCHTRFQKDEALEAVSTR